MLARLSPELRVMLRPARTYRQLASRTAPERAGRRSLGRLALAALAIGLSVALGATGRASLGLVLSCAGLWSFALAVQASALAAVARPAPLPFPRLLELFLLGHAPWSLWMLLVSLAAALTFPQGWGSWRGAASSDHVVATALLPLCWSAWIAVCFFREVMRLSGPRAFLKALCYEALVWSAAAAYVWFAAQLWPRLRALL